MAPDTNDALPVSVLVPSVGSAPIGDFLDRARSLAVEPFAAARVAALDSLSKALLTHARLRRDPAGASLGFWLRRSNLSGFEADFRAQPMSGRRVAAGLVFHVAPANVDTMFIYSWALSFLAGNANVVRLTTRLSPLMGDLLACLDAAFAALPETFAGNLFVTYGHDESVTTRLSAACDTRFVWGGDDTVLHLRAIPLSPHAAERSFASKRSLSVIAAGAYLAAGETARDGLAERMASDLAPFGQMACSSPQVLYWSGERDACLRALRDFDGRLQTAMAAKLGEADLGWAVRRLNHSFGSASDGTASEIAHHPHETLVLALSADKAEPADPCGVGLLNHAVVDSVDSILPLLRRDHQTVTYFGLSDEERDRMARLAGAAGVDRVVPIGRALDFGPCWDGFNLWNDLTRLVVVG